MKDNSNIVICKNKGFTLVELLVVIVILGIITGFTIPLIRNIQNSNKNSKFKVYEKALIDNAKLYVDAYGEDMFGKANYGCNEVPFEDMNKKMFVKDIQEKGVTCNNPQTFVRIIKLNDKYTYETHISCTTKDGKVLYSADNIKSTDIGECKGGAMSAGPSIEITPNKSPAVKVDNSEKNKTVKVTIVSSYGITAGSSFYYAWSYDENGENLASNWKQQMLGDSGIDVPGYRKAFDFNTNQLATGDYYLQVRTVDNNGNYVLKDAAGNTNETTLYHAGPYVVDKTAPNAASATVTSTTSWNHKEIKYVAGGASDNINGTNLRVCLSQNNTCTNFVTQDKAKLVLSGVSYNGANVTVNIFIRDLAGNQTKKSVTYKLYQECLDANLVMTTVKSTGACSKPCDGGTRTDVYNTKDKTSGNACSKTLNKTGIACNTMGCCSSTNVTHGDWSGWGSCSAACGNSGVQYRTRTNYVKSNYNGKICSQSTETGSQACNRRDCCGSKKISRYGDWYDAGSCNKSCGGGTMTIARTRYYVSDYNGQSCGSDTEYGSRTCNTHTCAPAQPSIYNPTGGGWTKNNFSLTVSTSTSSSGVGYWYWSYDNWNWTVYSDSYGKTSYVTSAYSAERNQLSYTRVCNRSASGPNDSKNCSPSSSTWIRIDKTAPSYSVIPKNEAWQGAPRYLLIQYSDSGSGLGKRYLSNTAGAQNVTYPTISFNGAGAASDGLASAWWSMPWALTICDTLGNCQSGTGTAKW